MIRGDLVSELESRGIVVNKWDILEKVGIFRLIINEDILSFKTSSLMFNFIKGTILACCENVEHVIYSASPCSDIKWKDYIYDKKISGS